MTVGAPVLANMWRSVRVISRFGTEDSLALGGASAAGRPTLRCYLY